MGLIYGGKFAFQIDWASLIISYFVFEGNFQVQVPGGLIFGETIKRRVFLCYEFWGLIFGEAYTWSGLFSEFYDSCIG